VATFTQLASGNWRVQVRRKTRYVAETFRRRKDGEEWALEMERNIDRNGSSKTRVVRNVRTFGDLIDLHDDDMREVGKPPRRSKAAVMASLKTELGSVKLPSLNRERLIEFGRKRAKQGAGPATLAIDMSFIRTIITHAAAVHGIEVSAEEARLARVALSHLNLVGKSKSVTGGPHKTNSTNSSNTLRRTAGSSYRWDGSSDMRWQRRCARKKFASPSGRWLT
jgi:hypothetical protein